MIGLSSYGMIKSMPLDASILIPLDGSNNIGEMKVIIELFDYILNDSLLPLGSEIRIFIDTQYIIHFYLEICSPPYIII